MRSFHLLAAALPLAFILASAAPAAVLDQNALNAPGSYGGYPVTAPPSTNGIWQAGQTVTTGISGLLSRIDLLVGGENAYGMTLKIRSLTGGAISPDAIAPLASFDFTAPKWGANYFYSVTSIDVSSAGLMFAAGDKFAITLESRGGPSDLGGWADAVAPYAGGNVFYRQSTSGAWNAIGADASFATYVETGVVPEPASWAMMIGGFGLIGGAMRRRASLSLPAA